MFRDDRDPFIQHDEEDCSGLGCRDDSGLLPRGELEESGFFECQACADEYQLLLDVVEKAGDDSYYDRAMAAFHLAEMFDSYKWTAGQVDALALDELIVIRAEKARYELQQARNASGSGQSQSMEVE